jgi:hypothetical protein
MRFFHGNSLGCLLGCHCCKLRVGECSRPREAWLVVVEEGETRSMAYVKLLFEFPSTDVDDAHRTLEKANRTTCISTIEQFPVYTRRYFCRIHESCEMFRANCSSNSRSSAIYVHTSGNRIHTTATNTHAFECLNTCRLSGRWHMLCLDYSDKQSLHMGLRIAISIALKHYYGIIDNFDIKSIENFMFQ